MPPPLPVSDAWPPPPPAPPAWAPEPALTQASARDRRWPVVLLVIGGLLAASAGVAIGAATGTATAAAVASTLAANGQYARAIAIDEAIAVRTGPFYLLDPGAATAAGRWAAAEASAKEPITAAMTFPAAASSRPNTRMVCSVSARGSVLIVTSVMTASVPQEPARSLQRS